VQTGIGTPTGANSASYIVSSGATLENSGGTGTIAAGSISGAGSFKVSGGTETINVDAAAMPALVVNGGTLAINGGTAAMDSAASLTLSGNGTVSGSGTLTVTQPSASGPALTVTGGAMNGSGVTVVGSGSSGTVSGSVVLTGSRELRAAGSVTLDATDLANNQGGAASLSTVSGGTLTLGNGSTNRTWNGCCQALTINNAGTLSKPGANTVSGNFSLVNNGTVNVDLGSLGVNGNYSASGASTTALRIAGTTAGSGYAQLVVGGAAGLNGILSITTDASFSPPSGSG